MCDKLCVKDNVRQSCVRKVVVTMLRVTKLCVCEGAWQRWCVKESVTQMCVEDVVCSIWCVQYGV